MDFGPQGLVYSKDYAFLIKCLPVVLLISQFPTSVHLLVITVDYHRPAYPGPSMIINLPLAISTSVNTGARMKSTHTPTHPTPTRVHPDYRWKSCKFWNWFHFLEVTIWLLRLFHQVSFLSGFAVEDISVFRSLANQASRGNAAKPISPLAPSN